MRFVAIIIVIVLLFAYNIFKTTEDEYYKHNYICTVGILTKDGTIKKTFFVDVLDISNTKTTIEDSEGRVFDTKKFHYYRCKAIKNLNTGDIDINNNNGTTPLDVNNINKGTTPSSTANK